MLTIMNSDSTHERAEVITIVQRRRRWTTSNKLALVRETYKVGKPVFLMARETGVTANQLYLAHNNIEHTKIKAFHPQKNGT